MKNTKNIFKTIPRGYTLKDRELRKEWIGEITDVDINDSLSNTDEEMKGIIENYVGFMKLPMAVVGPLRLKGSYADGEFCIPLCTLEGTLSMSMNRGISASNYSGGFISRHFRQELSRSPIFIFDNLDELSEFKLWFKNNKSEVISIAETTTNYGKIIRIDLFLIHNYIILDIVMETGNAAGQNMVSLAAKKACDYIYEKTGYKFFLESNLNSDKKASARNMLLGRGHAVTVETTISDKIMKRVLKMDPDILIKNWEYYPTVSSMIGTYGNGLHISNALTALYLATGQDTACVAENSIAHLDMERKKNGIKFKLTLPSLTVGTVGGGTRLAMQKQNLKLIGCADGKYSSRKLAEIIASATLGLEISLACAVASHTWTNAHMKYGRE